MSTRNFRHYRDLVARFDSTGTCGHQIKKGDAIGYSKLGRWDMGQTQCAGCWEAWKRSVAADDFDARSMGVA